MEAIPEDLEFGATPDRAMVRLWIDEALLELAIDFIAKHLPEPED